MITAIVGCMNEESNTPISGNGKGVTNTGFAWLNHVQKNKRVWSNYKTDFSENVCGFQEMLDTIADEPQEDLLLVVTEMGKVLNSLGSKTKQVLYIENAVRQLRKVNVDLQYDEQRYKSIHLRLRVFTDCIFIPMKFHENYEQCNYNLCQQPHLIAVYQEKPQPRINAPKIWFDATAVGQHYDTNEVCYDQLVLRASEE